VLHDDHGLSLPFSIDPFRRECLLLGLDDIGLSLKHGGALEKFEQRHDKEFWYAPRPVDSAAARREAAL
jgi:3-isopropylmalate/(R)-2-methylmalate dehydratase small subunit